MELLQDGVVAALAAIGVTALIWLAASLLLWRERPVDAVYLVRVSGDGTGLDVTLRRLAQSRRLPVLPMWMARAAASAGAAGGLRTDRRGPPRRGAAVRYEHEIADAPGAGGVLYRGRYHRTGEVSRWASA